MTESAYQDPPRGISSLRQRLKNVTQLDDGLLDRRLRTMAAIVVAHFLPPAILKGGTSMALRRGAVRSRSSADVDVTRLPEIPEDQFVVQFRSNAEQGWSGFQGVIIERPKRMIPTIPEHYVILPLTIRLSYLGSSFRTINVELSASEFESEAAIVAPVPSDIIDLFVGIGLEQPKPVALLSPEHQIAQKLHACTTPNHFGNNQRAHDLVDLQLLIDGADLDLAEVARAGRRLVAMRNSGTWPPVVRSFPGWEGLYEDAAHGLAVRPFGEALRWANELVVRALAAQA